MILVWVVKRHAKTKHFVARWSYHRSIFKSVVSAKLPTTSVLVFHRISPARKLVSKMQTLYSTYLRWARLVAHEVARLLTLPTANKRWACIALSLDTRTYVQKQSAPSLRTWRRSCPPSSTRYCMPWDSPSPCFPTIVTPKGNHMLVSMSITSGQAAKSFRRLNTNFRPIWTWVACVQLSATFYGKIGEFAVAMLITTSMLSPRPMFW